MNILRLTGVISFETAENYLKQINDSIEAESNDEPLIIEMSSVTACDSAGIAVLLEVKRTAIENGVLLRFVDLEKQLIDLAKFLKVDQILFSE